MNHLSRSLLAVSALAMMTAVAEAKTFVYCSEASPEGFDPSPYTAGTTFDASAHPIYNRLTEFKKGTTEVEPGLAAGRNQGRLDPSILNPARDRAAGDPEFSGQLAACD